MTDEPIYLNDDQMATLRELTKLSVDEVKELRKLAQLAIKKKYENQRKEDLRDEILEQLEELSKDKYIDQKVISNIANHLSEDETFPYLTSDKTCSTYTLEKIKEVKGLRFKCVLNLVFIKIYTVSVDYSLVC